MTGHIFLISFSQYNLMYFIRLFGKMTWWDSVLSWLSSFACCRDMRTSQWSQFWMWISASCWMKFPVIFLRDPKHYCLQKIACNVIQKIPLMLQVGDRVLCYQYTGDLYREHVVVPASNCFVLPSCMNYEDGAALAANYLTAYFCVLDIGHMRAGQSILISSCAGIIHPIATQIFMTCWTI